MLAEDLGNHFPPLQAHREHTRQLYEGSWGIVVDLVMNYPLWGIMGHMLGSCREFKYTFTPFLDYREHLRHLRRIWACNFPFAGTLGTSWYNYIERLPFHSIINDNEKSFINEKFSLMRTFTIS